MNRKGSIRRVKALLLIAFCFICHNGFVFAADLRDFSAEMVNRSGGQSHTAKIYVSGEKTRTESAGSVMIMRMDKNVMWMVMPSEQMYMEQPLDVNMVPKTSEQMVGEIERVSLGKEMFDGSSVEKFKVTYEVSGQRQEMYQWMSEHKFPVKMEAIDGSWSVEYRNISLSPQPDSLFEVPAGFQKASMPSMGGSGDMQLDDIMPQADEY